MKTALKRIAQLLLLAWAGVFVTFCIVVPRAQKKAAVPAQVRSSDTHAHQRVRCLDDNREALLRRLQVIESAERELILSTYYFGDDDSARDVSAALLAAADRGVDVRILVDGLCAFTILNRSSNFKALAESPNIRVKIYNPVNLLWPWKVNYRMHDKYLVADDDLYILGGRNTRNVSLGQYSEKYDIDRDILVYTENPDEGDSLHQIRAYFESIWALDTNREFTRTARKGEAIRQALRDRYETMKNGYPEAFGAMDWASQTVEAGNVTLLHNPIQADRKEPTLWAELVYLMGQGEQITIQTPYIICNHTMLEDLRGLSRRGADVKVITNAAECGANPCGCADYLNQRHKLRSTGMEIYEYAGPHSAHSKSLVIDDSTAVVGSFNFDMRSAYLDTEMMLYIESPELTGHLREMDEDYMARSRSIQADGTRVLGEKYEAPYMPIPKYILYWVLRLVILPFRHLL